MSICPDKDLYSAYLDGELLSPWKEKLEAHMEECPKCRAVLDSYKNIHTLLSAKTIPEPDYEASFSALCEKRRYAAVRSAVADRDRLSWFSKSVSIPVPLLAAAAMILFVFTPILMITSVKAYEAGGNAAVSDFKPIVPVSTVRRNSKKFNFRPANMLISADLIEIEHPKRHVINLSQFAGLYMPSEMTHCDDFILVDLENNYPCLQTAQNEFIPVFIKNEQ